MIKYLFIVINSFLLFVYGIFSGDNGITVTGTIPTTMIAGQEVPIEIVVNKGGMSGFAKLQIEMPEGFTVKESDEQGATYSFSNGIAKWVWAVLPSQTEITVKLVVIPSESDLGTKAILAKYSFVENNVKQVVEMTPAEVTIIQVGDNRIATEEKVPDPVPEPVQEAPVTSNIENPGDVSAERSLESSTSKNEYTVSVVVKKGLTRGFARYSDDLPNDVIVKGAKTDGASFSVADGKIKFVWVNVPEKENLEISYVVSSSTSQEVTLNGEYSYLEDNQSKKFTMVPEKLIFELSGAEKEEEPEPVVVIEPEKEPEPVQQITEPIAAKEEEEQVPEQTKTEKPAKKTTTLKPRENEPLAYRVQIGAFSKRKVTVAKIEKKFKVSESIDTEMQGGFTKFMVGSHQEYKSARDHRETMISANGIKSSFVVAYNQGKRITVQEALMITNQTWYK